LMVMMARELKRIKDAMGDEDPMGMQ